MNKTEYQEYVQQAAEDLILSLDPTDDQDLDQQCEQYLHELQNTHPILIDENQAIAVLRLSNHPTAEFFHHETPITSKESKQGKADFPFMTCASAAFAEDIKEYLNKHHGFTGTISPEHIIELQKEL